MINHYISKDKYEHSTSITMKGLVVGIVSCDAGGAEILSSWILRYEGDFLVALDGPAKNIFKRKVKNLSFATIEKIVERCDWILTGTGGSNYEKKAIYQAKKKRKRVVSFLDHWTSYRERFILNGTLVVPDEIWVGDVDALRIAQQRVPEVKSYMVGNPYFNDITKSSNDSKNNKNELIKILYLSSNFDDCCEVSEGVLSDFQMLSYTLDLLPKIFKRNEVDSVVIRPHPSERRDKYKDYLFNEHELCNDQNDNLIDSIEEYTHIVGPNSMALVVGKLRGKFTINVVLEGLYDELIPDKYIDHVIKISATL